MVRLTTLHIFIVRTNFLATFGVCGRSALHFVIAAFAGLLASFAVLVVCSTLVCHDVYSSYPSLMQSVFA
jgi:hypothetical protein